jgi:hypothetical protein
MRMMSNKSQRLQVMIGVIAFVFISTAAQAVDCESEEIMPRINLPSSAYWSSWMSVPGMHRIYNIFLPPGVSCEVEIRKDRFRSKNCPQGTTARVRGITQECATDRKHPSCACLG